MHLIRAEWLKIKSHRIFWLVLGAYCFIFSSFFYGLKNNNLSVNNLTDKIFELPGLWHNMSYVTSYLHWLPALLLILLCAGEFRYRTLRQNVVDGWRHEEFLFGKLSIIAFLSVLSTLLLLVLGWWLATETSSYNRTHGMQFLLRHFAGTYLYLSLALLMILLVKRAIPALVLLIVYSIFESSIGFFVDSSLMEYLPMATLEQLIPNPFMDMVKSSFGVEPSIENKSTMWIATIVWCALLNMLAFFVLKRQRI